MILSLATQVGCSKVVCLIINSKEVQAYYVGLYW